MKSLDLKMFSCPNCHMSTWEANENFIMCNQCKNKYVIKQNKIFFSDVSEENISDALDKLKYKLKSNYRLYNFLIDIISPVCPDSNLKKFIKHNVSGKNKVAINLGCGSSYISSEVINFDYFPYDNVDITGDILNLPIKSESVDIVINIAVLEHISDPEKAVSEFYRVLKKGGVVFCNVPFIYSFHASPCDYSRRTYEGMKVLFEDFEIIELKPSGGPTSGLLNVFQEWVCILFSFGNEKLYICIYVLVLLLTFPFKFIDVLLKKNPMAKNISSNFTIIAMKK